MSFHLQFQRVFILNNYFSFFSAFLFLVASSYSCLCVILFNIIFCLLFSVELFFICCFVHLSPSLCDLFLEFHNFSSAIFLILVSSFLFFATSSSYFWSSLYSILLCVLTLSFFLSADFSCPLNYFIASRVVSHYFPSSFSITSLLNHPSLSVFLAVWYCYQFSYKILSLLSRL
jgi:hypothetical protein